MRGVCAYQASFMHFFFFFNDTATTEIYTLSLHDALPIYDPGSGHFPHGVRSLRGSSRPRDRKSTRLNSSHITISYAVFCLKKKQHKIEVVEGSRLVYLSGAARLLVCC